MNAVGQDLDPVALAQALIGPAPGRTRVLVSHDPERFRAEADQVLRLGVGERAEAAIA